MIESKKITIIAAAAMVIAVAIVLAMMLLPEGELKETLSAKAEPLYANQLFGTDVMTIDIIADETAWQTMLDNASNEEYISVDVVINNKKITNVGIRPKGNNSLQQVESSDSDRYSFKIKFDEYVDGQTCFGLDMLVLNNMIGDATFMKEYTAFDMMKTLGIETPYFNYADISLNGEKWGFYFAMEAYNDSYEQRVSGDESGVLYNVKTMGDMGGKTNDGMDFSNFDFSSFDGDFKKSFSENEKPTDNFEKPTFDRGGKGGFGGSIGAGSTGGALVYTDDNNSSYSAIFSNAVGNDSTEEDYQRVITAIKALNNDEQIEEYFDVDEILRYLAVHTVLVNLDSYSSQMAQNYYIYEYGGKLQILPWDYNYAWGAFQGGSASETVNFPIDTPVSGVEMSERPLISKLLENEEYLEAYHGYLKQLMDEYFSDGKFSAKLDEINKAIGSYVEKDPTAFYTYDKYTTAIEAFKSLAELRMTSIYGQLDGTIPSTSEEQAANPDKLVDSSGINLSDLGSGMGGGKDFGGNFGNLGGFDRNNRPDRNSTSEDIVPQLPNGEMPEMNGVIPQLPNGEMPEMGGVAPQMPNGEMPEMGGAAPQMPNGEMPEMGGAAPQMP
ncbi:MAG: CotH kinase family protein, partial [Oscillospiraceae bacterium]|nr:CotH kinase family protein [Oscillospiraceae bacterium]